MVQIQIKMVFETLSSLVDERGIARLTLLRPHVHNALNMTLIREMRQALRGFAEMSELRALVLTGSGKSFCAGGDLKWMQEMTNQDDSERMKDAEELALLLSELNRLPFLVVGRINGPAYGGGLGLISCCDIAIGVESATFSLSEVTLGLIPATISPYVVKRLGESNARRVMLNARRFSAKEAVQLGLLHQAVPDEDLDAVVEKEVNGVLRCAPEAVSASKKLISAVDGRPAEKVLNETIERLAQTWETESCREGIAAFLEKRKPSWNPEDQ